MEWKGVSKEEAKVFVYQFSNYELFAEDVFKYFNDYLKMDGLLKVTVQPFYVEVGFDRELSPEEEEKLKSKMEKFGLKLTEKRRYKGIRYAQAVEG